ncbi:M60 family metallopeptidase [Frondihabitans sp. VKM Ac-2883]|uniref:M60 family metallopeptidase n=1 Tax=Frondihabitans sp. VKM Ac-2883 TaxID=2783823 RepID=UPI00188B746D|nr:M60 family metallopeptidase [Frondihabitans sp. VKM Ac-2883]MBF4576711.1 hypothetical protein [Frondihabitans sp. VKM Ac-2883]
MITKKLICGVLTTAALAGAAVVNIPAVATATPALESGRSLAVSDGSSLIRAEAQGDAARVVAQENRWFRHSDLQPTGRFVKKGQKLTVTVPAGARGIELATGLYGMHREQNGGKDVGLVSTTLNSGVNVVTASLDGMVFVKNRQGSSDAVVEVAGGQPVPTWVEDETTRAEFDRELATWSTAPYVEVVSDRILVDFQASVGRPGLSGASKDVAGLIDTWDSAVDATNRMYGLRDGTAGVAGKSAQRIYVSNPDTGAGYASATNDRITFQNSTNAGKELIEYGLAKKAHWGFWHEIGHTYQPQDIRWGGMTEVTVNISALAVQESMGYANRLDDASTRAKVAEFRKTPVGQRNHASISDLFVKVLMFDQLRRSFGDDFYPRLAQEWRVEKALGMSPATGDAALQQHFARTASKIADRNLAPFFDQWGIALTAETRAELATLPALRHEIWNNHNRATDVIEREVGDYVLPVGSVTSSATKSVTIGQESVDPEAVHVDGLENTDGSAGAELASASITALRDGKGSGTLNAVLTNAQGVRNVLLDSVDVTPGNLLRFNGIDRSSSVSTVADVALDASSGTLRALSRGVKAHDVFGSEEYLGLDVLAPNGRVVIGAAVKGVETADAFARTLDHYDYQNGQYLVVRHKEATSRLLRFTDDVQQGRVADKIQYFRITDDRLVRIAASEVPKCTGSCSPTVSVEGEAVEGTSVTVRGTDFIAGEKVALTSQPAGLAGTAIVGAGGRVEIQVPLVGSVKPGRFEIAVTGPSSKVRATTTLTVTEKEEEVPPPGGSCGVIPDDSGQ